MARNHPYYFILLVFHRSSKYRTFDFIVTIQTLFSTFSIPAQNAILPYIVSDDDTLNARSLMNMFIQMIQVFSYMCSGIIISFIGITGAIGLDSITFFVSILFLSGIKIKDNAEYGFASSKNFFINVKNGFAFCSNHQNHSGDFY